MESSEYFEVLDVMLEDTAAIIHNQQVLAGIQEQIRRNEERPFEQDLIYRDQFERFPSEPITREMHGVQIVSRVLHQTGLRLSDVAGADLMYEIKNEKFGLIQYKKESSGRIRGDKPQLRNLLDNCPEICYNRRHPLTAARMPSKLFSFCGCWYAVFSHDAINGAVPRYVPACEAEFIFQTNSTASFAQFRGGIARDVFLEFFASCRIGALVRRKENNFARDRYIQQLIEDRHIILEITQQGTWSS